MANEFVFGSMKMVRGMTLRAIDGLSDDQLLEVRAPFHNNILWNLGHVLLVQYHLSYGPSGLALPLPEDYAATFGRGTSPSTWTATPNIEEIKKQLDAACETVRTACGSGAFAGFKPYPLPMGVTLSTPPEAMQFHCIHEGIHLGAISAMRKVLA
jgi:hypothetical protein